MADYTEEEKQAIVKFKRHFREIKTARIGYAIRHEVDQYTSKLHQAECRKQDEIHHVEMMAVPDGTRVLVKFGTKANNLGTIYGRGRKYLYVKLDNGEKWKLPTRHLTVKVDDKMEKMTAQTNQMFQGVFTKVLAEVDAKEKGT